MSEVSGERSVADAKDRVLDEHRKIREMTQEIEGAPHLAELVRRLQDFRAHVELHFVGEEAPGGLYEIIRTMGPEDLGQVEQLQQEHWKFVSEIDHLIERARECLEGPVAEILKQAGALARGVRRHEARENKLLMDTAYTDSGHGD